MLKHRDLHLRATAFAHSATRVDALARHKAQAITRHEVFSEGKPLLSG